MSDSGIAPNVLLVDDDAELVRSVREGLEPAGFQIESAGTLAAAWQRLSARTYAAVILDLGLPDGTGLELADALRAAGSQVPILMLTARSTVEERVDGFAHGADDYLCKPFAVPELQARLEALLRRSRPERQHVLRYAGLELDLLNRVLRFQDRQSLLSDREIAVLAYLMRHAEEPLTRSQMVEQVWGDETDDESILKVYINYVRNKIEHITQKRLIHTVRGVGYMLSETEPD